MRTVIEIATVDDLDFQSSPVKTHPGDPVKSIGHKVVRLRGVNVPKELRVVYIHEEWPDSSRWLVLNWMKPPRSPVARVYSIAAVSEADARAIILREIKECLAEAP